MNQHWHWQTWQDCNYLTCDLLEKWQHGFFTQQFYPRLPSDLTTALQAQSTAYRVKQVHGNVVLTLQEIDARLEPLANSNALLEADGVISDRPNHSAWVASADCTPILIGDLATGHVCGIHAGWRGTAQKIVPQAIARLIELGTNLENLRIAIGPAISGEMYQVDEAVAVEVGKTIVKGNDSTEILTKLKSLTDSPILEDELPGKVRLNVSRVNQIQLESSIDPAQIAIANYCTYQHDNFFSYRRTGEKKVQWSGIVAR